MKLKIESITIILSKEQGNQIKDLIQDNFAHTFPRYCAMVGIAPPNFYQVLNGDRKCTVEFLNKLLSGIQYEVTASNTELQIQEMDVGQIVPNVDSMQHEDELLSDEREQQPDIIIMDDPLKDDPESCSSERVQEILKTVQENHLLDDPE